ncbi:MAG: AraC family transcriptional regulator [Eubacteriales bacterium]|nr:AraC family transcriptional regulator [Eubacteriales bacterium]
MREEIISYAPPTAPFPFWIEMTGISYCDGSYHIARKNSGVWVLEYIEQGRGEVRVNGRVFTAGRGDVYLLPEGSDHDYTSSREEPWVKKWINARGPLCGALCRAYGLSGVYHMNGPDLSGEFDALRAMTRATPDAAGAAREGAVLFHRMLQKMAAYGAGKEENEPAGALKAYLEASLERPVTLADMAAHLYRSPAQTVRLFRTAFGETPCRYLQQRRLEGAALLLAGTRLPVQEIARRFCFADAHYFANVFRGKYGLTPSAYRRGNRVSARPGGSARGGALSR